MPSSWGGRGSRIHSQRSVISSAGITWSRTGYTPSPPVRGAKIGSPSPGRLVEDHAFVVEILDQIDGFRSTDDQPRGHDADPAGAFSHYLGAEFGVGPPLLVDPLPAVPPRRGHFQEVPELVLPLDHQRLGEQD